MAGGVVRFHSMEEPAEEWVCLPVKQEELPPGVKLRDHTVDGIQEYDQSLPSWWLCILFGVIFFSIIYWLVIDAASIVLYLDRELYFTTLLFMIYIVIIFFGFSSWLRSYRAEQQAGER